MLQTDKQTHMFETAFLTSALLTKLNPRRGCMQNRAETASHSSPAVGSPLCAFYSICCRADTAGPRHRWRDPPPGASIVLKRNCSPYFTSCHVCLKTIPGPALSPATSQFPQSGIVEQWASCILQYVLSPFDPGSISQKMWSTQFIHGTRTETIDMNYLKYSVL